MSSSVRFALVVGCVVAALVAGCGYKTSDQAFVELDAEHRRLFIEHVKNPTVIADLEQRLRTLVRDEFTKRGYIQWVVREDAQGLVELTIHSFSSRSSVLDEDEQTVKSEATISLQAVVTSAADASRVWDSGLVTRSRSFFDDDLENAENEVIELAVQELTDRLGRGY